MEQVGADVEEKARFANHYSNIVELSRHKATLDADKKGVLASTIASYELLDGGAQTKTVAKIREIEAAFGVTVSQSIKPSFDLMAAGDSPRCAETSAIR